MRRQGFACLRGLVGKISGLVFVVTVVLLPGLLQQGFAVGLFGLVGGWLAVMAGGSWVFGLESVQAASRIRAVIRGRMGFPFSGDCFDAV